MTDRYPPTQKPYTRNAEILEAEVYPEGMRRVALSVEYNGADFHGFQKQPGNTVTVQGVLESALSQVANETVALVCAGRTDAGVHATNQIVHFDTLAVRPLRAWTRGVNAQLPDSVSVRWAQEVSAHFHARFSAHARTYRYVICNTDTRPALGADCLTWIRRRLDEKAMRDAAQALVGEHDFTSFRAAQCQAHGPVREIHYLDVARRGDLLIVEVKANAFLHHMVRNIVGSLLEVGLGDKPVAWMEQVLAERNRCSAGVTAKPNGLHLVEVGYPDSLAFPVRLPGPHYVQEPLGAFSTG